MPTSLSQSLTLTDIENTLVPIFNRIYENAFLDSGSEQNVVDINTSVEVYTLCYNYVMKRENRIVTTASTPPNTVRSGPGGDIYHFIDQYFENKAKTITQSCPPADKIDILIYILKQFKGYRTTARIISRMVYYLDRDYIQRRTDEGAGWLGLPSTSKEYKAAEEEELRKWEYDGTPEGARLVDALASAQAASPIDRLIPTYPLSLRRFRTGTVEPLVVGSKDMMKWVKDDILAQRENTDDDARQMVKELKEMLHLVGIHERVFS